MGNKEYDKQLTSDIQSKLTAILKEDPGLSPEVAMARITREMLKNNPFVPPEGGKCPINILPDELLVHLFETGVEMEMEASQFGENDDDIEFEEDFSDEEEDGKGVPKEIQVEVVDFDSEDGDEWSDVDEEEGNVYHRRGRWKEKSKNGDDDEEEEEPDRGLPFQVLISHVCKRWRSVVLDTPVLWTRLNFEKGTPLEKYKAYVERAKNTPLEINIDCTNEYETGDGDEDEDDGLTYTTYAAPQVLDRELVDCLRNSIDLSDSSLPCLLDDPNWYTRPGSNRQGSNNTEHYDYTISELSEILDLIIPRVQQWKALSVSVCDYRWMYLLLARLHQCPPAEMLNILELYVHDDNEDETSFYPLKLVTSFTPFRGQAPYLRHCVLWGVHLDWDASLGFLKDLEDLDLAYHVEEVRPSYQTFRAILRSPKLQTLVLSLSGPRGTEDDWRNAGHEPAHLPSLERLVLRYHSQQYARSLLRFIDTPNLRSLGLDFDDEDYTEFALDLCKAPFGRSKTLLAGLENLKLSGLPCDRVTVEKVLDELSSLKSLNLNCLGEGEEFFEAILRATTGSTLSSSSTSSSMPGGKRHRCPSLDAITTSGITGKQMREFVETRRRAGVPIQKVMMSENDEIDVASEKWLKKNVKEFDLFEPSDSEEEFEDQVFDVFDGEFEEDEEEDEEEEDDDDDF